jgi:hypothetical protein
VRSAWEPPGKTFARALAVRMRVPPELFAQSGLPTAPRVSARAAAMQTRPPSEAGGSQPEHRCSAAAARCHSHPRTAEADATQAPWPTLTPMSRLLRRRSSTKPGQHTAHSGISCSARACAPLSLPLAALHTEAAQHCGSNCYSGRGRARVCVAAAAAAAPIGHSPALTPRGLALTLQLSGHRYHGAHRRYSDRSSQRTAADACRTAHPSCSFCSRLTRRRHLRRARRTCGQHRHCSLVRLVSCLAAIQEAAETHCQQQRVKAREAAGALLPHARGSKASGFLARVRTESQQNSFSSKGKQVCREQ